MVSGWGRGATLPGVAARGRTLLPDASQGVAPQHRTVSGHVRGRHMVCPSRAIATCRHLPPSPTAAFDPAVRRRPPPAPLERATAERRRHVACSSRAITTHRRQHPMLPCSATLHQLSWRGAQRATADADDTGRSRLARSRLACGGHRCCSAALPSASPAGESDCGLRGLLTARGVLVSLDRYARATEPQLPCGAAPTSAGGERLQSADCTWRSRLARSRRAGGGA
jgi:hypothetical protein